MKKQINLKKNIRIIASILIATLTLSACQGTQTAQEEKIPSATYLGGHNTLTEVSGILTSAGVSNVTVFKEWVADFMDSAGKEAHLEDTWSVPDQLNADVSKCMDGWEQHHDDSDTNCRMTAFLLLDGLLSAESTEETYDGTYLMFDTEAIDKADRYAIIKKNKRLFTTLFGEKHIADEEHPEAVFSDLWKQYGFQINSDKISLLSIVITDPYLNIVFVGHTGILIKCEDYYLFVEKIAFEQPYQATKVHNLDELLNILSQRPEYFGEEGEPGPFVYNNGELIDVLIKNSL